MEQKPKYTVEQILDAIEASHLPLFVMCVDEGKVEVGSPYVDTSLTVVSDADTLFILHTPVRYNTLFEKVVLASLKTALHILFDK